MSASSYQADEGGPFQVIYLTDYDTGSTYSAMGATTLISKAASVLDMVTVVALCLVISLLKFTFDKTFVIGSSLTGSHWAVQLLKSTIYHLLN
ncbi:hypothetical protein PENANT_c028G04145 [Penicillium antarcticum]|uniref:Uncharacterized protein n=1 Tax=Penicillium antarcticum TaxID=416450 RepID=A0A1V6PWI3_9EURO|nr:hypothetical protein PENANT_c028G04145 [Penicillium antarcticum]